jgi:sortase A
MRRGLPRQIGLIAIGILLVLWGATSAFSDYARSIATPDPLDNPDAPGAEIIYPTLPIIPAVTKTPFKPEYPIGTGEPAVFSIPLGSSPDLATPTAIPVTTGTPVPEGMVPERIVIPAIDLDAPIRPVAFRLVEDGDQVFQQWLAPDTFEAGWLLSSAMLGLPGNTVLDGHHNIHGEVFGRLIDLDPGDIIFIYSGDTRFKYTLTNKMILPERGQPMDVRIYNAQWLLPSADERLTLVTCWPYESNSHRLIIVASPAGRLENYRNPAEDAAP